MTQSTRTFTLAVLATLPLLTTRLIAQERHETPAEHGKAAPHTQTTDAHAPAHAGTAHSPEAGHDVGPVPPEAGITWPWLVLWAIFIMFLLAAVIGPLSRMHAPPAEEMPPTHSHDEPPGASDHHGASGTINPEPDHGHH